MPTIRHLISLLGITLAIILISVSTAAADLALCVDRNDWSPYTFGNKDGTLQILVKMAANRLKLRLTIESLPWKRCEAEVKIGELNGLLGAAPDATALKEFAFPLKNGLIDNSRALAETDMVLLKRAGSPISWDGQTLKANKHPIASILGYYDISDRLTELGIPIDEGSFTTEQNARKVVSGHNDAMATYTGDAKALLANPDYDGKLEMLPIPLGKDYYFLVFNRAYYDANHVLVEKLWDEVNVMKQSPAYLKAIEHLK